MSHDSGFRQGGSDFSYGQEKNRKDRGRGAEYEQRMAERFHEHERKPASKRPPADEPHSN